MMNGVVLTFGTTTPMVHGTENETHILYSELSFLRFYLLDPFGVCNGSAWKLGIRYTPTSPLDSAWDKSSDGVIKH